jgi:hypothetical protein
MSDIYGPDRIFVSRAHDDFCAWLPNEPHVLDGLTGGQLAIAGDMPVVCSTGFGTPAAAELLALAGIEPGANQITFRAGEDEGAFRRAASAGAKLVLQHALPADVVTPGRCWIDPALLAYLNNKASLGDVVEAENVPERRVVDRARYFGAGVGALPVVLKAVTDQSNGGGCAVMVCRTSADLEQAARLFEGCEQIVAERLLDIERNPCLNFAVMRDGEVRYLGFADQDISPVGKYRGNWLDRDAPIAPEAVEIAIEPVRRAAVLGYRGLAGVDLAMTCDGRTYVLDLNFRANGCTTAILLADAVTERSGARIIHFRTLRASEGAEALARMLRPDVEGRRVVPLNLFDPVAAGYSGKPASAQVLVLGSSRDEVLAIECELARRGSA